MNIIPERRFCPCGNPVLNHHWWYCNCTKFEKVVEWGKPTYSGKNFNDKHLLYATGMCVIPGIGILMWVLLLILSWKDRKVYWRKIRN